MKIAVVDTGFCSSKAKVQSKKHIVKNALDMTKSKPINCKKVSDKDLLNSPRFHGQLVLNEFLKHLPKKMAVTVYPVIVYDKKGMQSESAWKKTLKWVEKEKMDLVLTASGFISNEKLASDLPAIWFVPSGRAERGITNKTTLFPQSLAPRPNLFVIGDYFDDKQIIYDQALLYQDRIDYFFPSGKDHFKGTSRAVAHAMGRALQKCLVSKDIVAAHSLRLCLQSKQKTLKDPILKKEFKTF